jgi:hypothetical protein
VTGAETVGKRTLIDQLVKEADSDELAENISLSSKRSSCRYVGENTQVTSFADTDDYDSPTNISFLINSYEVQLQMRKGLPIDVSAFRFIPFLILMQQVCHMQEQGRSCVFVVVYSIASHHSFTMAAEALYQIYEAQKSPGQKTKPVFHALLIGNKMDLQRNRKVTPSGQCFTNQSF